MEATLAEHVPAFLDDMARVARLRPHTLRAYRAALLRILRTLTLRTTTQDVGLSDGIRFLLAHARSKGDRLTTEQVTKHGGRIVRTPLINLS